MGLPAAVFIKTACRCCTDQSGLGNALPFHATFQVRQQRAAEAAELLCRRDVVHQHDTGCIMASGGLDAVSAVNHKDWPVAA